MADRQKYLHFAVDLQSLNLNRLNHEWYDKNTRGR